MAAIPVRNQHYLHYDTHQGKSVPLVAACTVWTGTASRVDSFLAAGRLHDSISDSGQ